MVWILAEAGGGGLQMLQRAIEADNVLPKLPQGPQLLWRFPLWVSFELVLQGSAVLVVLLPGSAVPHLLLSSCGQFHTQTNWPVIDRHKCNMIHCLNSV